MHINTENAITIDIDDKLLEKAKELSCIEDIHTLVNAGLKALIEKETRERLSPT